MRGRLRACLLGILLLHSAIPWPLPFVAALALSADQALAQSRSSGGYARPSSGGYSRTPSFSTPRVAPRTPSTSGGYQRPSNSAPQPRRPSVAVPSYGGSSAGDRDYSRQRSSEALGRMRAQDAQRRQREMPADTRPTATSPSRPSSGWGQRPARSGGWYGDRGWSPPGYAAGRRSFGMWDGVFLWFLLSNLNRPGSTDFFRNHQDDPGYRAWRYEAEQQARDNAEISAQLQQLDRSLAATQDQPRDPDYLPPDVPSDVALARSDARTPSTGENRDDGSNTITWIIIPIGIGIFLFLAWRRRRAASQPAEGPVRTTTRAADMIRHKMSGEGYAAQHFRLGMVVKSDPTPFLLAGPDAKVTAPDVDANRLVSIQAVGRIAEGGITRLYLPDGHSLFELYESRPGTVEGCRFFDVIDEVTPADDAEWRVWLDPAEGMIGWTQFQTKDGKLYDRVWSPGGGMAAPRRMTEAVETVQGTRTLQHEAMLYAAPTGAAAPGPQTEYILVSAVQDAGRAWVEIRAGIDINLASLSLA